MRGDKGRIGFLWPADGLNDDEFWTFLPEDVAWLTARYHAGPDTEDLTLDTLHAYAEPRLLERAADLLRPCAPDVVACGDQAASFIRGVPGELLMQRAVEKTLSCPAVTMTGAVVEALRHFGAKNIAVASPYSEAVTEQLLLFLRQSGFSIQDHAAFEAELEEDIGTRTLEDWALLLSGFLSQLAGQPDALLFAGGGVRFADGIEVLEARFGVPVVTGPGALVWCACNRIGVDPTHAGHGRLFAPPNGGSNTIIRRRISSGAKTFAVSNDPPVFVSGSGSYLIDEHGKAYLDFACGSGTTSLGHGQRDIKQAVARQLEAGITHVGPHFHTTNQARLYEYLSTLLPPHLTRFHPATNGTEATEVAIKAAMHATGRRTFYSFEGGYHGRTFGALALSGARGKNEGLGPFEPPATVLPFPATRDLGVAAADILASSPEAAGIVIEVIQATAGFRKADKEGLAAIVRVAQARHIPIIVDEVFTGFGRIGRMFAFEEFGLEPDLLIMAKSFGGGLPAGLVAGRDEALNGWPAGAQSSTFQLHPLAAAASFAFARVLQRDDLVLRANNIGTVFGSLLSPLRAYGGVSDIQGAGAFWAISMANQSVCKRVRERALQAGLLTWECGLSGEVIGLVPPLTVTDHEIGKASAALTAALEDIPL